MQKSNFHVLILLLFITYSNNCYAGNKKINLSGTLAGGAIICDNPLNVDYRLHESCFQAPNDKEVNIYVKHVDGQIAVIRIAGQQHYTMINHVVVLYKAHRISLYSYSSGQLPPGFK